MENTACNVIRLYFVLQKVFVETLNETCVWKLELFQRGFPLSLDPFWLVSSITSHECCQKEIEGKMKREEEEVGKFWPM